MCSARDAQTRGEVLLHGALAEKDGIGVILAAPGGTGKTTASDRLLAPWRSRCDEQMFEPSHRVLEGVVEAQSELGS